MDMHLLILTALLQRLDQPYSIEDNILIIEPTSSPMEVYLPGEWVDTGTATHLSVDLTTFDVINYMAQTINSLSETI